MARVQAGGPLGRPVQQLQRQQHAATAVDAANSSMGCLRGQAAAAAAQALLMAPRAASGAGCTSGGIQVHPARCPAPLTVSTSSMCTCTHTLTSQVVKGCTHGWPIGAQPGGRVRSKHNQGNMCLSLLLPVCFTFELAGQLPACLPPIFVCYLARPCTC